MKELLIGCGNSRERKMGFSGERKWDELVTLDFDPLCGADIQHDLNILPYPFPDSTFDAIHAYCVLEHLGRQGDWRFFFDQWAEFHRIVKSGGRFFGITPHYDSPWAWGDPSHTRIIGVECLTFLSQKQYSEQVGKTSMSDFRHYYKADWEIMGKAVTDEKELCFVLTAVKPVSWRL